MERFSLASDVAFVPASRPHRPSVARGRGALVLSGPVT